MVVYITREALEATRPAWEAAYSKGRITRTKYDEIYNAYNALYRDRTSKANYDAYMALSGAAPPTAPPPAPAVTEREELVRQIAELEAAMARMTYAPPAYMMQALASLKSQLAAIDAAASVAVSTTIDETEDAIDVPENLTREEIKRRIADLEAALLTAPPMAKFVIMTALVALRAQLAALDAAVEEGYDAAADEAGEAVERAEVYTCKIDFIKVYPGVELIESRIEPSDPQPKDYSRTLVLKIRSTHDHARRMTFAGYHRWSNFWGHMDELKGSIELFPGDEGEIHVGFKQYDHNSTVDGDLSPESVGIVDEATEFLIGGISGIMRGAVGEILDKSIMGDVGKGTKLGEIMAAQAPEAVKKGSPAIRVKLEEAERAVAMELDTNAKKLIDEMTKGHSPMTPDESTIAAGTIGAGSLAGFVGLSAAGAAIEAASLGQFEIPGHTLIQLGAMYGLAKMAGSIVSVPYRWAVDIGHNYKWASVFQPLIPGMTDLVRFEVREVWRPEFRKEQLEETPSEDFKRYAAYQGFSGEHADSYWAAHWVLPTVGQAYEMFHRLRPGRDPTGLTFTREDLYTLMRRQDILKRYRDPLIAIAYDIPTRREIRMMVNAGTLDRDEAEQIYLDRGIDPRFAGTLADFAWARAQRDPYRERIITACIGLAKEGFDTEDDFRARLKERNVPEQVVDDSWALASIQYEADYKRDLLAELRERLRKEKITIETFAAELSRIVPVAERANAIVERERARIKLEAS